MVKISNQFFVMLVSLSLSSHAIHFAVIGDYGVDNKDEKNVAELVKRNNPEFILTVGDNNYPNGCASTIDKNIGKYYQEYIHKYSGKYGKGSDSQRFFPSLGNHDWYAQLKCLPTTGRLPYNDYFTLPGNERYYDFVKGDVHFFALDSDILEPDGTKRNSKQYKWFKDKISKSRSAFHVVYFHHAPYSSGPHGPNKNMQWDFDALGVELVMAGHDHIYERIEKKGVTYIVNGLGGAAPYDIAGTRDVHSQAFYNEKHGAVIIDADETSLRLQFKNYEDEVIDDFTISKSARQE